MADPPSPVTADWRITPEPSFERPPVSSPIEGSRRTLLAIARLDGDDLHYMTRQEQLALAVDVRELQGTAREAAEKELKAIEPQFVRDPKGVVLFALLDSDRPVVASTVLAPSFGDLFEPTFGPDLIVAIPSRNRVYVFPKLAGIYDRMSDYVRADYDGAIYPVSTELFSLKDGKLKTIGRFGP